MLSQRSLGHDEEDYLTKFMRIRMENQQNESNNDQESKYENSPQTDRSQKRNKQVRFEGSDQSHHEEEYQHEIEVSQEQENRYQEKQFNSSYLRDQQNKQNPCDDSFLNLVDNHLENLQKQAQVEPMKQSTLNLEIISISKKEVSYCLLQNETTLQIVQLTNLLPSKSIAKIINAPFQFRLLNAKNKFLKRDQVEIILQPYQSIEIQFEVKKRQNQIGNIYETLRIDSFQYNDMKSSQKSQSKFLKFQITFVKPKLQVNFFGRTSVKRIHEHKIANLQIYPNEMGEYCFSLLFSQDQFSTLNSSRLEKIQCQIETKGYVSIHPSSMILYQNEPLKIMLRRLTQSSGIGKTSAVLIKPLNSSLTYVLGVKCMQKTQKSAEQQNFSKMNKLML